MPKDRIHKVRLFQQRKSERARGFEPNNPGLPVGRPGASETAFNYCGDLYGYFDPTRPGEQIVVTFHEPGKNAKQQYGYQTTIRDDEVSSRFASRLSSNGPGIQYVHPEDVPTDARFTQIGRCGLFGLSVTAPSNGCSNQVRNILVEECENDAAIDGALASLIQYNGSLVRNAGSNQAPNMFLLMTLLLVTSIMGSNRRQEQPDADRGLSRR